MYYYPTMNRNDTPSQPGADEIPHQDSSSECEMTLSFRKIYAKAAEAGQVYDNEDSQCVLCDGTRGGVDGNSNIIDEKRVCDYCTSDAILDHRSENGPWSVHD